MTADRALLEAFLEFQDANDCYGRDALEPFLAARAQPEARTLSPLQLDLVHASVQEGYKPPAPPVERLPPIESACPALRSGVFRAQEGPGGAETGPGRPPSAARNTGLPPCEPERTGTVRSSEPEKFWRLKDKPGWRAVEQFYDEQGRLHTRSLSTELRATRAEAEADGAASGLRPWQGGGK